MVQYNGDLRDRIAEVPVEPWETSDFERIIQAGSPLLRVSFSDEIRTKIFEEAHGSVGVVQELLKKICETFGISETCTEPQDIDDMSFLERSIRLKVRQKRFSRSWRGGRDRRRP